MTTTKLLIKSSFFAAFLAGITFVLGLSSPTFASNLEQIQKDKVLRVCTSGGYAPFEVRTTAGKWVGFDIEMLEKFAARLNVRLEIMDMRWEGVIGSLVANKCDIIAGGMSITLERATVFDFSHPVYRSGNSVVILAKNKDKYKTLSDLDKKENKIAVKTGNTSSFFLERHMKHASILKFDNNADMVAAVLENKVEAFVQDIIYAHMVSNEYKNKFFIFPKQLNHEDLAVGMRKQDVDLRYEFNTFLDEWKKDGGYQRAVSYYIESYQWHTKLN